VPCTRSVARRSTSVSALADRDLYRPFRGVKRPPRRQLIALLRELYGSDIPTYPGSPYSGTPLNHAEIVLHELAHMTQFGLEPSLYVGRMKCTWDMMLDGIRALPKLEADWHDSSGSHRAVGH